MFSLMISHSWLAATTLKLFQTYPNLCCSCSSSSSIMSTVVLEPKCVAPTSLKRRPIAKVFEAVKLLGTDVIAALDVVVLVIVFRLFPASVDNTKALSPDTTAADVAVVVFDIGKSLYCCCFGNNKSCRQDVGKAEDDDADNVVVCNDDAAVEAYKDVDNSFSFNNALISAGIGFVKNLALRTPNKLR